MREGVVRNCKDVASFILRENVGYILLHINYQHITHIFRLTYVRDGILFDKELDNKYFKLTGHMVSVPTTQLWYYSAKATIGNMYKMGIVMSQ